MGWIRRLLGRLRAGRGTEAGAAPGLQMVRAPDGRIVLADAATRAYWASTAPQPTQASLDAVWARTRSVQVSDWSADPEGSTMSPRKLLVVDDAEGLASLRQALQIVDGGHGHCMCMGGPIFELVSGAGETLATISQHHGVGLRWDAWRDDAALADDRALIVWLDAHGVPGPLREREEAERSERANQEVWMRWCAAAPTAVTSISLEAQAALEETHDLEPVLEALEVGQPDVSERILGLLAWYGSGAGPWTAYPEYEDFARHLLLTFPRAERLAALASRPASTAELEGAARLFSDPRGDSPRVPWSGSPFPTGARLFLGGGPVRVDIPPALRRRLREHCRSTGHPDNRDAADIAFAD